MTIIDLSEYLRGLEAKIRQLLERDLPLKAGNLALRRFKDNFQKQGFFGRRWREVKRRQNPRTRGAARSRPILTGQTGDLGRSLQLTTQPGKAMIESDLPYSAAHNEGTSTAGRGRHTRIPRRQFMGKHPKLTKEIEELIKREIDKAIKG